MLDKAHVTEAFWVAIRKQNKNKLLDLIASYCFVVFT